MTGAGVVTQPARKPGRPRRPDTCDACRLVIPPGEPVLFGSQETGCGPYPGMSGWYVARVHASPCGTSFLAVSPDYAGRPCRGCERVMWVRPRSRRWHCSRECRQSDYRRRIALAAEGLAAGRLIYRDELYWLTRPSRAVVQQARSGRPVVHPEGP